MLVQYSESFIEYLRVRDKALFAHLLIFLILYLLVLAALHLPETVSLILWRPRLAAARSNEFALMVAFNQMESYMAEHYCTVCCSSPTSRCLMCGAVAYCSWRCERDHWEQHHKKECPLMVELKGCNMNHVALYYANEQCKPCQDAGNNTNCKDSESSSSASKRQRQATAKTKSDNECIVVVNANSMSSKCKLVIYCSERGWINGNHRQKPQLVDVGGKIKEASKLKHLVPRSQTSKRSSSSYAALIHLRPSVVIQTLCRVYMVWIR